MALTFFPAIDLRGGNCVRLFRGDYEQETVYGEDPVSQSKIFEDAGARWIHIVDLDAAKTGNPTNRATISSLVENLNLFVQVGGGVRSLDDALSLFDLGVKRVVLGTAAIENPGLIAEIKKCGSVAVSLDCRGKMLATRGWTEESSFNIKKALEILDLQEPDAYIYTQIEKDGTLNGPDFDGLREVLGLTKGEVIASGGVSQLSDLKALDDLKVKNNSLSGIIVGRALYEGLFDVSEAIRCLSDRE